MLPVSGYDIMGTPFWLCMKPECLVLLRLNEDRDLEPWKMTRLYPLYHDPVGQCVICKEDCGEVYKRERA